MSTRSRTRLADTLPDLMPEHFPGHGENAPLDLPAVDKTTARQLGELFISTEFDAWSESLAKVRNCVQPDLRRGGREGGAASVDDVARPPPSLRLRAAGSG